MSEPRFLIWKRHGLLLYLREPLKGQVLAWVNPRTGNPLWGVFRGEVVVPGEGGPYSTLREAKIAAEEAAGVNGEDILDLDVYDKE